ncbi:MAG: hypothetical protein HYS87_02045 [Candidatus Colwellbacteria bacterium]|nr:hypothetical protein [Candidatus Colwellbacteria bacterium]
MSPQIQNFIDLCGWGASRFLIFSQNIDGLLVYYSHLMPLILALALGVFVYLKNRESLASRWLFAAMLLTSVWLFFDLILWATEKPAFVMFFWTLVNIVEPLIYVSLLFFIYAFISGKDIPFKRKAIIFALLLPIVVLAPTTNLGLESFDLSNCDRNAVEGPLTFYGYTLEFVLLFWVISFGVRSFMQSPAKAERQRIMLAIFGAAAFMLSFSAGNIIGSLLFNWELGQLGLFGIPLFVAILSYLIVEHQAFNIRVIGVHVLVTGLILISGSILFIETVESVRIVLIPSLILIFILSYYLVRGAEKIEQREQMEDLAKDLRKSSEQIYAYSKDLSDANEKLKELDKLKSEFLSFASHQVKAPMAVIKGYASLVRDGNYGKVNTEVKEVARKIADSADRMIELVNNLLDMRKIEAGKMEYDMKKTDLVDMTEDIVNDLRPLADEKKLDLSFESQVPFAKAVVDPIKFRQIIFNFVENAIKYTPSGWVKAQVLEDAQRPSNLVVKVADTGLGIAPSTITKLFQEFNRGDRAHKEIRGTGLGLFIAKKIVEDHGGEIWAESDGEGKGSTFYVSVKKA